MKTYTVQKITTSHQQAQIMRFHQGYAEYEIIKWVCLWKISNFIVHTKRRTSELKTRVLFYHPNNEELPQESIKYLSMPLAGPLHAYKQVGLPKQSNRQL